MSINLLEPQSPFGFRSGKRGVRKYQAPPMRENLAAPPQFAPDCPVDGRSDAIKAFDAMCAARPLRPPGR